MERPDTGNQPVPAPGATPAEPPTQVSPPIVEPETIAPTPPPALAMPVSGFVVAPGVPPALADHPRYRVLRLLGQGGMGAVYLAEHRHMERQVALKVMSAELVLNPEAVRRFRQEVTAAARIGPHPNVVAVHDADQVGDLHFLVMEYVEGQSLADYLRARGPLPVAEACEYVRQAALGLDHATRQGMVHRDIKPHNLMRTPQGQIKVLDFGLARFVRPSDQPQSQLTQQGVMMGTADYMAPEQASDSRVADMRADVYSLGCTLYHLLTGRVPFPEGGTVEKIIKHATEAPTPVGSLRRDLPIGVIRAIERMIAKDPAHRYQTPGEVVDALASWASGSTRATGPITVVPASAIRRGVSTMQSQGLSTFRPGLPTINTFLSRRIRRLGNTLMFTGYLNALMGVGMLFAKDVRYAAPIVMVVATLMLIGSVKMKERQSYRWALCAAYLALVPTICFPFTIIFGIRALSCLNDPQVRAAFP